MAKRERGRSPLTSGIESLASVVSGINELMPPIGIEDLFDNPKPPKPQPDPAKLAVQLVNLKSLGRAKVKASASTTDCARWTFAEPFRAKTPPLTWRRIADLWQKQTGEPCDEQAMKQACYRAKKRNKT